MAVTCVPMPPCFFGLPLRQIMLPFIGPLPVNSQRRAIKFLFLFKEPETVAPASRVASINSAHKFGNSAHLTLAATDRRCPRVRWPTPWHLHPGDAPAARARPRGWRLRAVARGPTASPAPPRPHFARLD